MQPRGVHHVSLMVADVEAARRFYVEVLGLSVRTDRPGGRRDGAWLDAGAQQVHLIGGAMPDAAGQHFALLVDDLAAAVDELRTRGVDVSEPSAIGTGRQAFLTDPSGNLIELHQPAP